MIRPTFDELKAIARGAVEAVELANPGYAVIVIVQEPLAGIPSTRFRTALQSNVAADEGSELCREMGSLWERCGAL